MRRIRHRTQPDYIVPIGQRLGSAVALSGRGNVVLERSWSKDADPQFHAYAHVKWNAQSMDGVQILVGLKRNGIDSSASIASANLYRIDQSGWTKTLLLSPTFSSAGTMWSSVVTSSAIDPYEFSGAESFSISIELERRRKKFYVERYFNHLGCFDSIYRLQQATNYFYVLGGDA